MGCSFKGPGILVCSIDNMPTQLPREATDFFGDLLLPHIFDVLQSDATRPFEDHKFSSVIEGAVITSNGKLTKNFEYIQDLRNQRAYVLLSFLILRAYIKCIIFHKVGQSIVSSAILTPKLSESFCWEPDTSPHLLSSI